MGFNLASHSSGKKEDGKPGGLETAPLSPSPVGAGSWGTEMPAGLGISGHPSSRRLRLPLPESLSSDLVAAGPPGACLLGTQTHKRAWMPGLWARSRGWLATLGDGTSTDQKRLS